MTEAQAKERMAALEQEIKEGELAQDFKAKYADLLNGNFNINFNNPKEVSALRAKLRAMTIAAHPDRGGSHEIMQMVSGAMHNLKNENLSALKNSLRDLDNVLNKKASSLSGNKAELNKLKTEFAPKSEGAKAADEAKKAEEAKAQAEPEAEVYGRIKFPYGRQFA